MIEPTDEQLEAFIEVMLEKHHGVLDMYPPSERGEALRTVIQTVSLDTYLMLTGKVPLEIWLHKEGDSVAV